MRRGRGAARAACRDVRRDATRRPGSTTTSAEAQPAAVRSRARRHGRRRGRRHARARGARARESLAARGSTPRSSASARTATAHTSRRRRVDGMARRDAARARRCRAARRARSTTSTRTRTGTDIGDIAETHATCDAVRPEASPISSTKGLTGHTLGACGAIESIFAIAMMRGGFLPPTRNLDEVDPRCAPLDYVRELRGVQARPGDEQQVRVRWHQHFARVRPHLIGRPRARRPGVDRRYGLRRLGLSGSS